MLLFNFVNFENSYFLVMYSYCYVTYSYCYVMYYYCCDVMYCYCYVCVSLLYMFLLGIPFQCVVLCILFCVNVYCTTATGCQHNYS